MSLEELQRKRGRLKENAEITLENMQKIADESYRVADVAHHARLILDDIDREFERQTGLDGKDLAFLFLAVGLQLARIVIMQRLSKIEKAGSGNRNEKTLHEFQDRLMKNYYNGVQADEKLYYASLDHIVSTHGVPYDATEYLTKDSLTKLLGKNVSWNFDLEGLVTGNLSLFKGANHRFSTLGHDPVLGLVFGTGNIMTNTITCVRDANAAGAFGMHILKSNHVIYTSEYKRPKISIYASTIQMLEEAIRRTINEPSAFAAALIKQIIHIGTDLYTPCGIQIPVSNLVLSKAYVQKFTKYISMGDLIKIGASAKIADFINTLISAIHFLLYPPEEYLSQDLYAIKTKKIIMYSNVIASASNVIEVGIKMALDDKLAIKDLDIGGLIVTIHRLLTDTKYIHAIKEEFVISEFNKLIRGNDLNLKEMDW